MAWPIYQWPRYSRLITIILIWFSPLSEVAVMIMNNTVSKAKYLYLFLPEEAKKTSTLFFTALIIPKKRSHQSNKECDLIFLLIPSRLTLMSPQRFSCQSAVKEGWLIHCSHRPPSAPPSHAHKWSMHEVLTCSHILYSLQHLNLSNPPLEETHLCQCFPACSPLSAAFLRTGTLFSMDPKHSQTSPLITGISAPLTKSQPSSLMNNLECKWEQHV